MPKYFFDILDHPSGPDMDGSDLADISAARTAAVQMCGEMISEMDEKFWGAPLWRLDVSNQDTRLLFTLTFAAQDAA